MLFVIHQLVPFYGGVVAPRRRSRTISPASRTRSRRRRAHHTEGLAQALDALRRRRVWPYYFYSTHHTVAGILLFTGRH